MIEQRNVAERQTGGIKSDQRHKILIQATESTEHTENCNARSTWSPSGFFLCELCVLCGYGFQDFNGFAGRCEKLRSKTPSAMRFLRISIEPPAIIQPRHLRKQYSTSVSSV